QHRVVKPFNSHRFSLSEMNKVRLKIACGHHAAKCRYRIIKCRARNLSLQGIPRYHKHCIERLYENDDERQDNDFF
ncbi:MAG: hypothetical protein E7G91_01625, partial [Serratia liquefaciens]|nr:hypothetical protein [Serratia liquefaciens]